MNHLLEGFLTLLLTFFRVISIEDDASNQQAYKLLLESENKEVFTLSTKILMKNVKNEFNSPEDISDSSHVNIKDPASKYGYDLEKHEVQTDDGYLLTLHRIPHRNKSLRKNVDVFLMHGLMDSSDCWMIQGPDKALAYLLSDYGYDVWLGNARGNKYSNAHTTLNSTDAQFWKFTWEEIGLYDLTATIDYILNNTQRESLYYVGHSQGTTSFYVMMSMKPAFNRKIKTMFSLSPVAFMANVKSPIARMFSNTFFAYWLSHLNIYTPSGDFFNKLLSVVCYVMPRCDNILYLLVGDSGKFINEGLWQVIFAHFPTSSSTMQILHYGQLVQSKRFCRYDFGKEVNVRLYNETTPPDYELRNVTAPVVLFYAGNDWLSDPADVKSLAAHLPNVAAATYLNGYNHLDFLYANNAKENVYLKIVNHINNHEIKQGNKYHTEINK